MQLPTSLQSQAAWQRTIQRLTAVTWSRSLLLEHFRHSNRRRNDRSCWCNGYLVYKQADGSTHGAVAITGGTTVTAALSTGNAVNTTNTFGATTITGGASTTTVSVTQDAAATAAAAVKGVVNGAVSVLDANRASATKAGTITDVTVGSGAAVVVNSSALENIYASGKMTTLNAGTLGALTTAAIDDIHLHVNGLTTTGNVSFDTDVKTITINAHTTKSTLAGLVDASATTVNVIGDAALTVSAHTLAATASISTADSTGGATFTGALGNTVTFTGGAGADTISLAANTKTITTGGGNDSVTLSTAALGYLGTVDAGEGTDTLTLTAANAITATANATFEASVSGFERLTVGAATAGGTVKLANLDDINYVTTANVATGQTLTFTGASSGFTLVNNAGTTGTGGITVTMTDATGTSDTLNVNMSAAAGKDIQALTATGFEVLNFATDDSAATPTGIAHVVSALTDADATTINVSGDAGLNLTFTGTKVTSFDASGVTKGAITWTSGALAAAADVKGGAGANTVDLSASSKAMTYTGGAAVDTITTGAGADNITTAGGNDVFVTGNGANTVDAGAGNDGITGGTGVDNIDGGAGNDTIAGGGGADILNGGAGTDSITGGSAADTVDGGDGTDTFTMTLAEQAGSGTTDGTVINLGATAVTQSAVFAATGKYLSTVGATVATNTTAYLFSNESSTNAVVVDTLTSIESAVGTTGVDYVVGSAAANTIDTAGGVDYIITGAGIDTINQDGGDSVARSASTFAGGTVAANDTLTFGNGVDIVADFTAGNGGDILDVVNTAAAPTTAIGEDQTNLTEDTIFFLSGDFVASTGVFTIKADGAGGDTLIFENETTAANDVLTTVNNAIVLVGVDSDDLVAANFG